MLLYSTMLNIKDVLTETDFIRLLIDTNKQAKEQNRIAEDIFDQWNGEDLKNDFIDGGLSLRSRKLRDENIMAACFEKREPDGQYWNTSYVWNINDKKICIQLSRSYAEKATTIEKDFHAPSFIKTLIRNGLIEDDNDLPLSLDPIMIRDDNIMVLTDAIDHIENYRFPIVYVSKKFDNNKDPLAISDLAKKLRGVAHLLVESDNKTAVSIAYQSKDKFTFNGAVSVYYPSEAYEMKTINRQGEYEGNSDEFINKIINLVLDYTNNIELPVLYTWDSVTSRIDFLKLANKKELLDIGEEHFQDVENALEQEKRYAAQLLEEKAKDKKAYEEENYKLKSEISVLNDRIRSINDKLVNKTTQIPTEESLKNIEDWVNNYFPGKLLILGRAISSAKKSHFEDEKLVYESLKLLGTTYWNMRMFNEIDRADFDAQCKELGIEEGPTISDTSAGELGGIYTVKYHGENRKMDRHLKKGSIKDPRYCMRIYFFWDDNDSQIVICSLPEHLDTTFS